jgi:hypothetical protein
MLANDFYAMLNTFIGTTQYYRHWSGMRFTDGVKFLADTMNCHWFLDVIASYQNAALRDRWLLEMQFWELRVRPDRSATVVCRRDLDDVAFQQEIPMTDFPFEYVKVYVENGVILLPSEH